MAMWARSLASRRSAHSTVSSPTAKTLRADGAMVQGGAPLGAP